MSAVVQITTPLKASIKRSPHKSESTVISHKISFKKKLDQIEKMHVKLRHTDISAPEQILI